MTARGIYECRINGKAVSDEYFAPVASQFDKHLYYQIYDVTNLINSGENGIGFTLSSGWWNGSQTFVLGCFNLWGDRESVMAKLVMTYADGMKKCRKIGKIPVSMGIDTWGVDFVLTDASGNIIGDSVSYRDKRADNVSIDISDSELYAKTGIQKQKFNTVYQLAYLKNNFPEQLENAEHMLMLPDYFNFLLTGNVMQKYTNATTTGLVNAEKCDWDLGILKSLGFPEKIFSEIHMPCILRYV